MQCDFPCCTHPAEIEVLYDSEGPTGHLCGVHADTLADDVSRIAKTSIAPYPLFRRISRPPNPPLE
jgi:hypothetical protein